MENRIKSSLVAITLCCSFQAVADPGLDRLIKAQEEVDKGARQESKVLRNDVYSSADRNAVTDIELPIEENCFEINEIVFENDFLNDALVKKIRSNASGRCLGIMGIQKVASDLQDHFINAGYVTTRVEVPDQDVSEKRLVLRVVPGRIEQVIIEGNDVKSWILPFKSDDLLNLRDIEQGLEVLQRVPGLNVKINIEPGSQNGYSNVVINTGRTSNANLRAWLNNWGDEYTGEELIGGAVYLYNMAQINDVFYLSGTTNAKKVKGGYDGFSSYYSIPYGYWDIELFHSHSKSQQPLYLGSYDFMYTGRSTFSSLKGSRVVYRDQNKKVAVSAELTKRKVKNQLADVELVLQKRDMTNARFGVNYKQNFPGAVLDSTFSYQRFVPWLGGEKTPDMKSGDVSSQSHIFDFDLNYIKLLNAKPFDSYYELRMGGQYSPAGLTLQDQYTIGNRWNVRGFENSAGLYGNKGIYFQNTLNVITGIKNAEWYLGADYGHIWRDMSSQGEKGNRALIGATTGIKGSISSLGYDVSVSAPLAYPNELDVDRFNINFNFSYQL